MPRFLFSLSLSSWYLSTGFRFPDGVECYDAEDHFDHACAWFTWKFRVSEWLNNTRHLLIIYLYIGDYNRGVPDASWRPGGRRVPALPLPSRQPGITGELNSNLNFHLTTLAIIIIIIISAGTSIGGESAHLHSRRWVSDSPQPESWGREHLGDLRIGGTTLLIRVSFLLVIAVILVSPCFVYLLELFRILTHF